MTDKLSPNGRTITFEINDASLLAGTWIFSSFLKGVDNNIIEDVKIVSIQKGKNSFFFSLVVTFFSEMMVTEILADVNYLISGKFEDYRTKPRTGLIWGIIERAAKYILKNKAKSMKVQGIEVLKVNMDPKIRDELLSSDDREIRRLK